VKIDGAGFDRLVADLEVALRTLTAPIDRDPALWTRSRPGKWTAGQQVEHIAISLEVFADALEKAAGALRSGALPPLPRRGPLATLFAVVAIRAGYLPRGGRTPACFEPADAPERSAVMARIAAGLERQRALGASLRPEQRDRLWIANPFFPRWHYSLPESVRMHAVHARHHGRQVEEIAALPAQRVS
jgi:hypothetical protein